ncbi:uncharacterized protein PGTG_21832 [Puccinia graminis f. sp. tritici CRL 75-36-700-3]|uniref:Uncharacterized protein n=1 Tax=Puccinia graminis f. sp. tritici (strain CRL 75-36-700-3 / race SCCL) TaxID=418459 RepID=H6QSL8_PUCGT|nr:uncharacterized protein PGTG_21832 [Puccinia graminis f. sp. tritici CRL 75-36-700-3]EHS63740.1 hypothetical protein PGTG_21832 [Puccinia graminis f. sp. tritici CRL 75-36-700-3]
MVNLGTQLKDLKDFNCVPTLTDLSSALLQKHDFHLPTLKHIASVSNHPFRSVRSFFQFKSPPSPINISSIQAQSHNIQLKSFMFYHAESPPPSLPQPKKAHAKTKKVTCAFKGTKEWSIKPCRPNDTAGTNGHPSRHQINYPDDQVCVAGEAFFVTGGEPIFFWDFARAVWHKYAAHSPLAKAFKLDPKLRFTIVIPTFLALFLASLAQIFAKITNSTTLFTPEKVRYTSDYKYQFIISKTLESTLAMSRSQNSDKKHD